MKAAPEPVSSEEHETIRVADHKHPIDRVWTGAAILTAALVLVAILIPVGVWRRPAVDATYRGFDRNLIFVSTAGPGTANGEVAVTPESITLGTSTGSHPTVHLITTPLSFTASLAVRVTSASPQAVPLRIGVWSPENGSGYFVVFRGDGTVQQETITGGAPLQDLVGGTAATTAALGSYRTGDTYRVTFDVDQVNRRITSTVAGPGVSGAASTITASTAPDVFKAFRYALTVSSWSDAGSAGAVVQDFTTVLPSQPTASAEEVVRVDDARATLLVVALLLLSVLMCMIALVRFARDLKTQVRAFAMRIAGASRTTLALALALVAVGVIYVLANVPLFDLASPHYDVFSARVWSYVAFKDGVADLYYRTLLVSAAVTSSGIPLHEAGFPYGMTKAYYYQAIGALYHFGVPGGGVYDFSLEGLLKFANVLFGFADGIFVYLILRRLVERQSAVVSAILFLLNPAIVFVMSVWGSTETVSLFFVLGSILLAERGRPLGAWLMLAVAAYTRPQMLVLAFLLGAVYLRKFELSQSARAVPWAVILSFFFIAPFALQVSPSLPVDYVERTVIFHFGNGQADLPYLGTSPGYYSIWTLPPLFLSHQHGLDRMWFPSTQHLLGSVTYGQAGAGLSVLALLVIGALILAVRNITVAPGAYLPIVALGMLAWLMLTPGLISRYFVYGIVAIILCRRVFTTAGYLLTVALLTVITLTTAYGHIALDFLGASGNLNVMSPTNNGVSHFVFSVFSADWFITLGAGINLAVLYVMGTKAWDSIRPAARQVLQYARSST